MGGTDDAVGFVRSNVIRLALLGLALLLAIIGAGLVGSNANGYDEAWSVLSIVILIIALYLGGPIVLFYLVLGFIYAVLPTWVIASDKDNSPDEHTHSGAALLSAALFFALFALTPSDAWQQFRTHFLGTPRGWVSLVVFLCNFFGCLLIWIATGGRTDADRHTPLGQSIFAFLNGLLFLIAYSYQYVHASVLGFLVFTYGGVLFLGTMVTTGQYSDTARAGAGFICFSNFVFIFIIWRSCIAPLTAAQQAHDAAAPQPATVSGSSVEAPVAPAPTTEVPPQEQGWKANIVGSIVRFAGLGGCLAVVIIGLLILRDTEVQAVLEIAAATAVGLLLVTVLFPTWDYSFIFIYIAIFLLSVPRFIFQRSNHAELVDGRSDSEIDTGLIFVLIGTIVAYFIREFSLQRVQRFTIGRDFLWLYIVGVVGELLMIVGLIILFSEGQKATADSTVQTVTIPLVVLLVYFFIQLHLDADINHRLVLLFLIGFYLEADLVAASSGADFGNNTLPLRRAGCGLCAIALYFFQFVLCVLHWNEIHKGDGTAGAGTQQQQQQQQETLGGRDDHGSSQAAPVDGNAQPNPYQQQVDEAAHSDDAVHSEAPVQTV